MPSDKNTVRSYVTAEEHEDISAMAARADLSVSDFIKKACLGREIKTFEHEDFKLELIKTRADLGRLGGLLKAALGLDLENAVIDVPEVRRLLSDMGKLRNKLARAVETL